MLMISIPLKSSFTLPIPPLKPCLVSTAKHIKISSSITVNLGSYILIISGSVISERLKNGFSLTFQSIPSLLLAKPKLVPSNRPPSICPKSFLNIMIYSFFHLQTPALKIKSARYGTSLADNIGFFSLLIITLLDFKTGSIG